MDNISPTNPIKNYFDLRKSQGITEEKIFKELIDMGYTGQSVLLELKGHNKPDSAVAKHVSFINQHKRGLIAGTTILGMLYFYMLYRIWVAF